MYALNAAMRSVTLFWLAVPVSAMTFPVLKPALLHALDEVHRGEPSERTGRRCALRR